MATQTLAQAAKLINNQIALGVAEDIISINPLYDALPFVAYEGQAIVVNREDTLGDAGLYSVGDTITHKGAAVYDQAVFTATKLIGDAELDGLVQAQSVSAGVDQAAVEISSKAKSIGRLFQQGMASGSGVSPQMHGLTSLCDSSQHVDSETGRELSFELLDELLDLVRSKDGQVDWIMMPPRTLRSYKQLLRSLGGTSMEMVSLPPSPQFPRGRSVVGYEGVPIFKNEYLSITETESGAALTGGALTSVWAGCFDDGSLKAGVAGIHPASVPAGVVVEPVGAAEDRDSLVWRVKQYANFVCFNRRGLARLTSISN